LNRAQAATELIIILGVALAVFLAIFVSNQQNISNVNTDFEVTKARTALDTIANAAEQVYQQGAGAKTKILVDLPKSMKAYSISNRTITLQLYGPTADITLYRALDFSLSGSIYLNEGNQWILIQSAGDSVLIGNATAPSGAVCGNVVIESGEQCDGTALGGQTCVSQGYAYGTLACLGSCLFDYSGCGNYVCGNNLIEGTEVCDGTNLASQTCITKGYEAGTLACASNCLSFNTSSCRMVPPAWVTNLANQSVGTSWLYWTWTNPTDLDFSRALVYLNGVNVVNTSSNFYNATGLTSNTAYTLTVYTMDTLGNINNSAVTSIVKTRSAAVIVTLPIYAQRCNAENDSVKGNLKQVCTGTYPAACGTDRLTCNDNLLEVHTANKIGGTRYYGGVNISSYDSLIANCGAILSVRLCYEWWNTAGDQDCDVSVDANGGISYSIVTTTCPLLVANPGVICTDVTALESWSCSNFFGTGTVRANAKSEVQYSGGAGFTTTSWDALYFNVTYQET
jgi:hypothetical protein